METNTLAPQQESPKRSTAGKVGLSLTILASFVLGWFVCSLVALSQKSKAQAAAAAEQALLMQDRPVTVETELAQLRDMNPPQEFMAHVEPIESTDLRAQIDGTIAEVAFKEGTMVKAGDLLFLIDPRVYEARVAQARAALAKAKASADNAERYYGRISKVDKRSITEAEIDQAYANMLEARAAIAQCEADLKSAEINLGYTKITAPISGRIGKSLLKKGDYVAPSMGSLARIVQTDPVRVVFSVPDKEYLNGVLIAAKTGEDTSKSIHAQLRLADGSIYAQDGTLDFLGNEMDASTASLAVRYRFANPDQLLLANAYVTILLSEKEPKKTLTIPANAALTNATGDYVYVNDNGRAARRIVKLGATQGGYMAILSGLNPGDEVICDGVVNISDGAKLNIVNPATKSNAPAQK